MRDATRLTGQRAAGEYLRQLLLKHGPYRDAWQIHVASPRDGVINQLAVAEVIAAQQHVARGRPGESQMPAYQVRDVVSGALFGGKLNADTLQTFIDAFGFSDDDSQRLRRLLAGSSRISVMSGTHAVPTCSDHDLDAIGPRGRHQTLSMHDHVWVGSDGRIDRGRHLQVIEATAQGVDRIPFACDTNVLTLEVGQGCQELTGEVVRIGAEIFATQILLARTLDLGETLTFEYRVSYRYPGDPRDPGEREYRRGGLRQVDNLDMRIEFHPDKLPHRVWWAHWDGGDGSVLDREAVSLDSQNSVHRYLRSLEKTIVGFYWRWDEGEEDD
jgi:hypothetical protein